MNNISNKNRSKAVPIILIALLAIFLFACACVTVVGAGILIYSWRENNLTYFSVPVISTPTPQVIRPDLTPTNSLSESPVQSGKPDLELIEDLSTNPESVLAPLPEQIVSTETLRILTDEPVPMNDPIELAKRLEGKEDFSPTLPPSIAPLPIGASQSFWISNSDTNRNFQITATLREVTNHAYFWIENGVRFREDDLTYVARIFDEEIYPANRYFFGSEWSPGVDGDPRIYILFARGLGKSIAGYYSSSDQFPPQANEYSNAHEMFLLSADILDLGDEYTLTVLAHEHQHMIHWNTDRNEESWMNEGFSELASFINGYGVGFHDYSYIDDPDIQLTDWPEESRAPHYGAAFLFLNYFLNRFGDEITQRLVSLPENGMDSIDQLLASLGKTDPQTGSLLQADDIFADWVLASYLMDDSIDDGRYTYSNYPDAPQASATETISQCPTGLQTREVSQYGVDYIDITCQGNYSLKFEGSIQIPVIPTNPYSGNYYFWSNRGDESNMTLTRLFDFSGHNGPLTMTYWTWFDLEKDYDYLYVEASIDGGDSWEIIITPSGTAEDPSGNSYGWGYNGASGDLRGKGPEIARWIKESVDLTRFTGHETLIRFEYITDAAVNGNGLVLDDIAIPEIGYFTDFEVDENGWEADGFVRIQNVLPQTYRLSVIHFGPEITIDKYTLANENSINLPISIGNQSSKVVLVVSGTTPFTRQKAAYHFQLTR